MLTYSVEFDTSFDSLASGAAGKARMVVAQAALEIEGLAKQFAPVDTGFMRNAITAEQEDEMAWTVTSAAFYSVYVEFGTSRMDAQPFMIPAIEIVRPKFERAMRRLL
jgi:HK97 gp10 family phage protein